MAVVNPYVLLSAYCITGSADLISSMGVGSLSSYTVGGVDVTACRCGGGRSDHVDELYRLIRSEDPLLVHCCLLTLDDLLRAEGGIVINRAMVRHLSGRSVTVMNRFVNDSELVRESTRNRMFFG